MSESKYQKVTPSNILTSATRLAADSPATCQSLNPIQVARIQDHAIDRFIERGELDREIPDSPSKRVQYVYRMFGHALWDRSLVLIAQRDDQDSFAPGRFEAVAIVPVPVSQRVGDSRVLIAVLVSATRESPAGILYSALNGKLKFRVVTFIPENSNRLRRWGALEWDVQSLNPQEQDSQEQVSQESASPAIAEENAKKPAPRIPHKNHKKKNRFPKIDREHGPSVRIRKYNRFSIKDRKEHRAASSKRRHDSTVFEIRPCRRNLRKRRAAIEAFRRRREMRLPPDRDALWE